MLTLAAERTEFFQRTDASSINSTLAGKVRSKETGARLPVQQAYSAVVGSELPVTQRPAYEWVVPSSATSFYSSLTDVMSLLTVCDAELETSREMVDSAVKRVLVSTYRLDEGGFGRLAAQEVMLFVEKNLRRNGLTATNRLLELADSSKLSSRSLIGLIRSTARLKDRLPAWKKAYLKSREEVAKQGKSPDALFVGLPKP